MICIALYVYAVADSNIMHIIRIKYIFPLHFTRMRNLVCHIKHRVFGNRVKRKIFGPKVGQMTGHWRELHNEELYHLYCSQKFLE
jgi:hypothetical protein